MKKYAWFLVFSACAGDVTRDAALPTDAAPPPLPRPTPAQAAFAGEAYRLVVTGVRPGAAVIGAVGAPGGNTCFGAICLNLRGARELGRATADASGRAVINGVLDAGGMVGDLVAFQAVVPRSGDKTAALVTELSAPLAIAGVYEVDYGVPLPAWELDSRTLRFAGLGEEEVVAFSNDEQQVVIFADNPLLPRGYARWSWTWDAGSLYLCPGAARPSFYGAISAPYPDATAPSVGGCNGSPWIEAAEIGPDVAGVWLDEWGTTHTITADRWEQDWGGWEVSWYSNLDAAIVAQNDAANAFFPGMWSRFDWYDDGVDLWYCQTAYAAASAWEARSTPAADSGDLLGGCGGFSWTLLTP